MKNRCHSCEAMMINGVYCHESGCPNRDWRPRAKTKPKGFTPRVATPAEVEAYVKQGKRPTGCLYVRPYKHQDCTWGLYFDVRSNPLA